MQACEDEIGGKSQILYTLHYRLLLLNCSGRRAFYLGTLIVQYLTCCPASGPVCKQPNTPMFQAGAHIIGATAYFPSSLCLLLPMNIAVVLFLRQRGHRGVDQTEACAGPACRDEVAGGYGIFRIVIVVISKVQHCA